MCIYLQNEKKTLKPEAGVEPATTRLRVSRSTELSYPGSWLPGASEAPQNVITRLILVGHVATQIEGKSNGPVQAVAACHSGCELAELSMLITSAATAAAGPTYTHSKCAAIMRASRARMHPIRFLSFAASLHQQLPHAALSVTFLTHGHRTPRLFALQGLVELPRASTANY